MKGNVIDSYSVTLGKVSVEVHIIEKKGDFVREYFLNIPTIGAGTLALMNSIKSELINYAEPQMERITKEKAEENKEAIRKQAERLIAQSPLKIDQKTKDLLNELITEEMTGLGRIEFLLADDKLEEIVINQAKEPIWVYHKKYGWLKTNMFIQPEEEIENYANIIARKVGKQITVLHPLLDAHLPSGDRVNATFSPISTHGNTITIRRFRRDPWTITDLIKNNTTSVEAAALIWESIQYELSIIFSGGTASGKCVTGETEVILENKKIKIKELVEKEFKKKKPIKTPDGYLVTDSNLVVHSFNPKTLKFEKKNIAQVWKRRSPKELIKIRTQTGKEITVTKEHPFFIFNNGLTKIPAKELVPGEFIATPTVIKTDETDITLDLSKINRIQRKKVKKEWRFRTSEHAKWINLPKKIDTDLARLIGFIIGSGYIDKKLVNIRFFSIDKKLLKEFKECGERVFNINGRIKQYNKCPYVEFSSKTMAEFFVKVIGISPGKKSHKIRLSEKMLFLPKKYLKELIKALFECKCHINWKHASLEFCSMSSALIKDISFALHRFGIIHSISYSKKRNRLFINGEALQEFGKKINLISEKKQEAIRKAKKAIFSPNIDFIPGIGKTLQYLKENLNLHDKEMSEKLSKRMISEYIHNERKLTKKSLKLIVHSLEKRLRELKQYKKELNEIMLSEKCNEEVELIKEMRKKINLNRKELAKKSNINTVNLWEWENNERALNYLNINNVSNTVLNEYNNYFDEAINPFNTLNSFKEMRIEKQEIAKMEKETVTKSDDLKEEIERLVCLIQENNQKKLLTKINKIRKKLKLKIETKEINDAFEEVKKFLENACSQEMEEKINELKQLCDADILWDKIVDVKTIKAKDKWVYDLTVEENHTFIANNLIVHNTTMLGACLPFIPANQRIISIEDTREISLPSFLHWVPLTTREPNPEGKGQIKMLDLLVNSLRMRPDRIIVGEIRRQREAEVLFEAMHTGHSAYTTVHANTAEQTIRRLTNPPISIPGSMLDAVNLTVVMFRNRRLGIRRTLQLAEFITEGIGTEQEIVKSNTLYQWKAVDDKIVPHNESIRFFSELELFTGLVKNEIEDELKEKQKVLKWMVDQNINTVENVGQVIAKYYTNKEEVLELVKKNRKFEGF